MGESIIWYAVVLGCGLLFYSIGQYAVKKETPMHFWSGSEVKAESITDVPAYNRENGRMWKLYSLWYWAAGLLWMFSPEAAVAVLVLGCTAGIAWLVVSYRRIEKKYKAAPYGKQKEPA